MYDTHTTGLSPRVRGNRHCSSGRGVPHRSIPACAGEPCGPLVGWPLGGVYPRVCGGTSVIKDQHVRVKGLSPRVRGNHVQASRFKLLLRSIPACAGEPDEAEQALLIATVYPRVCGGTLQDVAERAGHHGLSPRVRGNLEERQVGILDFRSIPACAGEPLLR